MMQVYNLQIMMQVYNLQIMIHYSKSVMLLETSWETHLSHYDQTKHMLCNPVMHSPKQSHMNANLKVVKNLKKCLGLRILLSCNCNMEMTAYCNVDYATCPMRRRFITGFCIKFVELLL